MISNDFATPRFAEKTDYPPDWHEFPHSNLLEEFVVVLKGFLRIHMDGSVIAASAGGVVYLPRRSAHEEWSYKIPADGDKMGGGRPAKPKRLELIRIVFSLHSALNCATLASIVSDEDGGMLQLARLYHREQQMNGATSDLSIALFSALYLERRRLSGVTESPLVASVRRYIHLHISETFSLSDLAAIAGLSNSHFTRMYRDLTGITPMEEARRIRLEKARYLIHDKGLLMKEVAPMLGYANQRHLARILKSELGGGIKELRGKRQKVG